jgi:hypothetical protein
VLDYIRRQGFCRPDDTVQVIKKVLEHLSSAV